MKHLCFLSLLLLLAPVVQSKASGPREIRIAKLHASLQKDSLRISFQAIIGKKATKDKDHKLTLIPVLSDSTGMYSYSLKPIEVYGHRVEILDSRGKHKPGKPIPSSDLRMPLPGSIHAKNGSVLTYKVAIPWQPWMNGSQLRLERQISGCCKTDTLRTAQLSASIITVHPALQPVVAEVRHKLEKTLITTADSLSRQYSFVVPTTSLEKARAKTGTLFNLDMPLDMGRGMQNAKQEKQVDDFIAAGEEGSLMVYFPQGQKVIERYFNNNNVSLVKLVSAIRAINASPNSRISKIVIAGFASPEGTLDRNDRLAWDRASALKTFVVANTSQAAANIRLFNGSEDWRGLRRLVNESDMYYKEEIIDIIDRVPIRQGRELQLMKLHGGESYLFMLKEMFPQLRNAAYIKVYYDNIPDSQAAAMRQAVNSITEGNYDDALAMLELIPSSVERDYLTGLCLVMKGDQTGEGRTLLQQAAENGSSDARRMLDELDLRQRTTKQNETYAPVTINH